MFLPPCGVTLLGLKQLKYDFLFVFKVHNMCFFKELSDVVFDALISIICILLFSLLFSTILKFIVFIVFSKNCSSCNNTHGSSNPL